MTADIAVIVLGVVSVALIAEQAWLFHSVAPRLRLTGEQRLAAPKTPQEPKTELPEGGTA